MLFIALRTFKLLSKVENSCLYKDLSLISQATSPNPAWAPRDKVPVVVP